MSAPSLFRSPLRPDVGLHRFSGFFCNYWRDHIAGTFALYIVNGQGPRPKALDYRQQWARRDRNSLWWLVVCRNDTYPKAVIRQHQKRRLRNAFRDALKTHGWDSEGRSVPSIGPPSPPLTGTIQLVVRPDMGNVPFVTLQKQCSAVVDELLRRQIFFMKSKAAMMKDANDANTKRSKVKSID
jgi:RNase P protein component